MPYDEGLAERVRDLCPKAVERKMFGGVGWMEGGNLVAGVMGLMGPQDALIVRVPPEDTPKVLKEPGVLPFEQRGKPMKGWVLVDAEAVADDDQLRAWVERSRRYVRTLPRK